MANPYGPSTVSVYRDAVLLYHNGKYYMTYTGGGSGGAKKAEVVVSVDDGMSWTLIAIIDYSHLLLDFIGGPEWFVDDDGTVYITNSEPVAGPRAAYITQALDADLTTWSLAAEITDADESFSDSMGSSRIERIGDTYYLWAKVSVWQSAAPGSGYSLVQGWPASWTDYEGPSFVILDDGRWRVYFDSVDDTPPRGLYYCESVTTDPLGDWGAITLATTPFTARHGGVIRK